MVKGILGLRLSVVWGPTKTSIESSTILSASPLGFAGVRDKGGLANAFSIKGETTGRRNGLHAACATFMRSREQLLPGISDDITLEEIAPKLPWRAFFALSCVSPSWQEAIRANLVYEARVRANSTETLIVHRHDHHDNRDREALALYSLSERRCYELPPIPRLLSGILTSCKCVAMDGKVYALGGDSYEGPRSSKEVFVLDLARQRKWKQCASMLQKRSGFGCSVMDGKIYSFGGVSVHKPKRYPKHVLGCEVYDTQEDSWSPIVPMPRKRFRDEDVARVGKELFMYSDRSSTLGAYDPAKNDWRLLESFWKKRSIPFVKNDKFYSLSLSGIAKYDVEKNSWVNLHTNSFSTVQLDGSTRLNPLNVWAGNDEVLLWASKGNMSVHSFQCKLGSDSEKKKLVWQETNCSCGKFVDMQCFIQL